jgi:Phage integrase family
MAIAHLNLVAPTTKNRTVTPRRRLNRELRTREHLTTDEVARLMEAAKTNRNGHRDATMVLLAFRHALRAAEIVDLRWDQIDFNSAVLHVRRVKSGTPTGGTVFHSRVRPHDRAGGDGCQPRYQGTCPHAPPRLRIGRDPADALLVASDGFFVSRRVQFAVLAVRHAIPAIYIPKPVG